MALKSLEVLSILLLTFVSGMYWGPWLALSRSLSAFDPQVFLAVVHQMNQNMATLMTFLLPAALLSVLPVLVLSYASHPMTFYFNLIALLLFAATLLVTLLVEVPIVQRMTTWTATTLPDDWQRLRARWGSFHLARIIPSLVGLVLVLIAAVFSTYK